MLQIEQGPGNPGLRVINDMADIVGNAFDVDHCLEILLGTLPNLIAVNRASVALMNGDRRRLVTRASYGLSTEEQSRGVYAPDEGVTGFIFRTAQPLAVPDVGKEPLFLNRTASRDTQASKLSFLGVPVMLNGIPIGVLAIDRDYDQMRSMEDDKRLLMRVASLVSEIVGLNLRVKSRDACLVQANHFLKASLSDKLQNFLSAAGNPVLGEIQKLVKQAALNDAPVLLTGEPGTGKSLLAWTIHELSTRALCPFVRVDIFPSSGRSVDVLLFGGKLDIPGDGMQLCNGAFREAEGGTLFLNGIEKMHQSLRAKLITRLREREIDTPETGQLQRSNVRIIASSEENLSNMVADGGFSADLVAERGVISMSLPPLRERDQEISGLIDFFAARESRKRCRDLTFTPRARDMLMGYSWPGNVRELENLLERLAIQARYDTVHARDLVHLLQESEDFAAEEAQALDSLTEVERREVLAALRRNGWVQARAARDLGITLRQMGYRVRKFGLDELRKKEKPRQRKFTDEAQ